MSHPSPALWSLAFFFASIGLAAAQYPLATHYGLSGAELGKDVSWAGDLNKDGYDDVIVGAPYQDDSMIPGSGEARVISGLTGQLLLRFTDPNATEFGSRVAGMGDLNNDGTPDFAVGSPTLSVNGASCGGVRVFSGQTGQLMWSWNGIDAGDEAFVVRNVGDVNGDGVNDAAVGAPFDEAPSGSTGSVRVYSGKTGLFLRLLTPPVDTPNFGFDVSGGDINGDGLSDIVVAAPNFFHDAAKPGRVIGYSGANGAVLFTANGPADPNSSRFAIDIAVVPDATGDGKRDVLASADGLEAAYLCSGANGSLAHAFYGDPLFDGNFGYSVDGIADVNGNGSADFLIASLGAGYFGTNEVGRIHVIDGATFQTISAQRMDVSTSREGYVFRVAAIGDANGDGHPDFAATDPYMDDFTNVGAGVVAIHSTHFGSWESQGVGCPGTGGFTPEIFLGEQACLVRNGFTTLYGHRFFGQQPALVIAGVTPTSIPMQGCQLLTQPLSTFAFTAYGGPAAGAGGFVLGMKIPLTIPPTTFYMQAFGADPQSVRGFIASQRLRITTE